MRPAPPIESKRGRTRKVTDWFTLPANWYESHFANLIRHSSCPDEPSFLAAPPTLNKQTLYRARQPDRDTGVYQINISSLRILARKLARLRRRSSNSANQTIELPDDQEEWRQVLTALGGDPNQHREFLPAAEQLVATRHDTLHGRGDALFSDCLYGFTTTELWAEAEVMDDCLSRGFQRLVERPDDIFLRAVISWAALRKGSPAWAVHAFRLNANYLAAGGGTADDVWVDRTAWKSTIAKIESGACENPDAVRRHLEDALHRAALLRWLKTDGHASALARRIAGGHPPGRVPSEMDLILGSVRPHDEASWLVAATVKVTQWRDRVSKDARLPQILLIWLTGRPGGKCPSLRPVLTDACAWLSLSANNDDSLVRWGTIWLSGMADCHTKAVFRQTLRWLATRPDRDDRLVRMSLLWLAGEHAAPAEVRAAERAARGWFNDSTLQHDGALRVAYLLWFVRRACARQALPRKVLALAIDETERWLRLHHDPLVEQALAIAASFARNFPGAEGTQPP